MKRSGAVLLSSIRDVPQAEWDALLDPHSTPFVRWGFLEALEGSGCAAPRAGWTPRHVAIYRNGTLVAAAPAYLKDDSDGDFSRDWGWASSLSRAGIAYYPKLIVTVPFTPVSGRRLLVAPGEDRQARAQELVDAALGLARLEGLATVQVLYPDAEDMALLEKAGLQRRMDFQYHWFNPGYRTFDDFLARFDSKHRNTLKRERAAHLKQGISIRTVRGDEIAQDPDRFAKLAHTFHRSTVEKLMWGRRWLNEKFYLRAFAAMPDAFELVIAERAGKPIAGAFNASDGERLFGRYWGCLEDHPFLHFAVCYLHSIEDCIARGIRVFEGGAGGEHKHARGFEPSPTWSAHAFLHPKLERSMRVYLQEELREREQTLQNWRESGAPFARPFAGAPR